MNRIVWCGIILAALSLSACKQKQDVSGPLVVRVFDRQLALEKILQEMPDGIKGKDSASFVKSYADAWVRQQLLLHQAMQNLSSEQLDVEDQLEKYKNSLIIYAYEKELVRQKLDTVVSDIEIESYYQQNPGNFELKENIIKVIYVKVKKNAPKLNKLREWCRSSKPEDRKLLEEYCRQFADNYYLDDETWLLFDDLLKVIPIETYHKEDFLKNNRYIESAENDFLNFVNIKAFKIKEGLSPLSFEKENIRRIILNKRKLKLIEQMQVDVYNEALNKKEIEFFN